jgi:methylated-DNA-[protein]-cysteine S-methyltransferase
MMPFVAPRSKRIRRKIGNVEARGEQAALHAFPSDLGWMAVAWRDDYLQGAVFGHSSRRTAELAVAGLLHLSRGVGQFIGERQSSDLPNWVKDVIDSLQRFASGEPVDFADVPLDLDHLTPFAKRVVAACRRIRWGDTRSYGELAAECEASGAARAVGTVMRKNRFPLIVPCHRVLASGGAIGGYSAPEGLRMKRRLLAAEAFAHR